MKQHCMLASFLLIVLLSGVLLGHLGGCVSGKSGSSTQPTLQPVVVARDDHDVYDLIVSGLTTLKQMGVLTDADKAQIEPIRKQVYDAIVKMDDAALHKSSAEFFSARQAYDLALPSLREWLVSKQKKSTTQPARIGYGNSFGNYRWFGVCIAEPRQSS